MVLAGARTRSRHSTHEVKHEAVSAQVSPCDDRASVIASCACGGFTSVRCGARRRPAGGRRRGRARHDRPPGSARARRSRDRARERVAALGAHFLRKIRPDERPRAPRGRAERAVLPLFEATREVATIELGLGGQRHARRGAHDAARATDASRRRAWCGRSRGRTRCRQPASPERRERERSVASRSPLSFQSNVPSRMRRGCSARSSSAPLAPINRWRRAMPASTCSTSPGRWQSLQAA